MKCLLDPASRWAWSAGAERHPLGGSLGTVAPADASQRLHDYLQIVRRWKRVIIITPVLVVATAVGLSVIQPKVYGGTAEVLLQNRLGDSVFSATQQQQQQQKASQTEIRVLKSSPVRNAVRARLGVAPKVQGSPIPETDLFEVQAEGKTPREAALLANTYVEEYINYRRRQSVDDLLAASKEIQLHVDKIQKEIEVLSAQISSTPDTRRPTVEANLGPRRDALVSQQALFKQRLDQLQVDASLKTGGAQLVTPATPQQTPISPKPLFNGVLGGGIGLMFGLGIAFLFEQLDDTIKAKGDLERQTNLPTLGLIPVVPTWRRRTDAILVSQSDSASPVAEAYRTLRTSINFIGLDRSMRTLQVTSPSAGDGKSATVANLGVALARAGLRVVVVGCDLRRPRLHEFFGLSNATGFTSLLVGDASLSQALQDVPDVPNLVLLSSGPLPPNPSELLASHRTVEVLVALQAQADVVLLDCPPVLPVTDAMVLSSRVDATLLVATAGKSTKREVRRAIELLKQVEAPLVGSVLNGLGEADEHYGGYNYRYYRIDEDENATGKKSGAKKATGKKATGKKQSRAERRAAAAAGR
jgi:capsular exopolysaccharide synthesis family protein